MPRLACPVLVGRSDEVRQLEDALAEAHDGSGRVIFVVGEAGIGKTRLLREIAMLGRDEGMAVLGGRAVPGDARIPFRPLIEALQGWTRAHGEPDDPSLTPYRSALGWLIPEWQTRELGLPSPVMRHEAVVRLVAGIGRKRGLVLTFDDLQWADADSLAIVEYLADNLGAEPVLCVCALRSDEGTAAGTLAQRLADRRAASVLVLERLTDYDVDEMIRTTVPSFEGIGDLSLLRTRSEGVPFLVEEMLSVYLTSGTASLPSSYLELVRARMSGMDDKSQRTMRAAAAIGRDFDGTVVAAITGLERDVLYGCLKTAIGAQLIRVTGPMHAGRFSFRHALIPEAVLEDLFSPERSELFLSIADALEKEFPGLPGELCQTAADLRDRAGDRTGASRLLLEIARRAIAATALGTAEAALRRAMELADGDRWRQMGAQRLLVQVLSWSGNAAGLKQIGDAALEFFHEKTFIGGPLQFSELHLQIARGLSSGSDPATVDQHLERARRWAEIGEQAQQIARIEAFAAHTLLDRGEIGEAQAHTIRALKAGHDLGLVDVMCEALRAQASTAELVGDTAQAVALLEEAKGLADDHQNALELGRIHLALARIDSITTTNPTNAQKAHELGDHTGALAVRTAAELELVRIYIERFELAAAAKAAEQCISVCRQYGLSLLPWALVAQAQILAFSDERARVESAVAEILALETSREVVAVALGEARAVFHLLREERALAVSALDDAESFTGPPLARSWPFHGLRALLKVIDGADLAEVEVLFSSLGVLSHGANRGLLAAAEAVHLGRQGHASAATARAAEAEEMLGPFVWRFHLTMRWIAAAAIADHWGEPARWADEARLFFQSTGHQRVAAACRGLLRRAGVRVARTGAGVVGVPEPLLALGFTTREVDVLRLVAEGMSNAEIAQRLFVSVRTVETHTSHLLQKAGVQSRPQLVAFANRLEDQAEVQ